MNAMYVGNVYNVIFKSFSNEGNTIKCFLCVDIRVIGNETVYFFVDQYVLNDDNTCSALPEADIISIHEDRIRSSEIVHAA